LYTDAMWSMGYLLAALSLCAVLTGAAEPLLRRLTVQRRAACLWAVGMILLAAVDGYGAALFMLVPAALWAGRTESVGLCAAAFSGMLALGALLLGGMALLGGRYGGLWCGLLAGAVSRLFDGGELSLSIAFGASACAVLLSFALEGLFGVVTPMAQSVYFDAAAAAALSASLLCAIRSRKPASVR